MNSLRLRCKPQEVDRVSAELWEAGTTGIREVDKQGTILLFAAFEANAPEVDILDRFSLHQATWVEEETVDWAQVSRDAWPAREIGKRLFLAPPWSDTPTPTGRVRLVHNPGLACGTGEHACTQLALMALEDCALEGRAVVDIGTGSGILAIAALHLGASRVIGADIDVSALATARENLGLNGATAELVCGSANALADSVADVTVANMNGTVLLAIFDDLVRITRRHGQLILTGFPVSESEAFMQQLSQGQLFELQKWSCLAARVS